MRLVYLFYIKCGAKEVNLVTVFQPQNFQPTTIESWENVITQPLHSRPNYSNSDKIVTYTRIAKQYLGIYEDEYTMKEYLYNIKSLPIDWILLFDKLPKEINSNTRTEIVNILQIHRQTPLSINRMMAFFTGRDLLPKMNTKYRQYFIEVLRKWLTFIDTQYPKFSHPNLQRLFLDFVKWTKYHFDYFLKDELLEQQMPRILWYGSAKESEAYFIYFLYLFGCDIVVYVPNGEDTFTKYGISDIPTERLAEQCEEFEFPHEKPIQIQTVTARTEEMYRQNFFDSSRINYPWKYLEHESHALILHTAYEEMFITTNSRMELREGFDADDTRVYLPVIFSKIDGVSSNLDDFKNKFLNLYHHELSYTTSTFPLIESQNTNLQFYIKEASTDGRLDPGKLMNLMIWPYRQLQVPLQRNIARTIIRIIDMKIIKFQPQENENAYISAILGTLMKLPEEVLKLYRQYDFSYDNPKYVLFADEQAEMQRSDAIFLVFLVFLGFDVFIFTPSSITNIERYLSESLVDVHRLDTVDFTVTLDELLTVEVKESVKESLFERIFNKVRRKS